MHGNKIIFTIIFSLLVLLNSHVVTYHSKTNGVKNGNGTNTSIKSSNSNYSANSLQSVWRFFLEDSFHSDTAAVNSEKAEAKEQ